MTSGYPLSTYSVYTRTEAWHGLDATQAAGLAHSLEPSPRIVIETSPLAGHLVIWNVPYAEAVVWRDEILSRQEATKS